MNQLDQLKSVNQLLRGLAFLAVLTLVATLVPGPAATAEVAVQETSYVAPDGTRVLRHELVVDATPEQVWRAFSTAEGLEEWAVPSAWMDFRLGGTWETSYDPAAQQGDPANIHSRILSYQPLEMVSIQAVHPPPGFEHPELLEHLFSVFTFEAVDGGRTRIRAAGVGYGEGEGYDRLYEFFQSGNAWTLDQLRQRFETGPVDWQERLRQMPGRDAAGADGNGGADPGGAEGVGADAEAEAEAADSGGPR